MKLGVPDNPNSKASHLFNPNYLLSFHEGLDAVVSLLSGSTLEMHFQLPEEIELEGEGYQRIAAHVAKARANGLNVMMHSPFLYDKNDKALVEQGKGVPLNMDFLWLEGSSGYKDIKLPSGVIIGQRRMDDLTLERTLELSHKLDVPIVTFHFTKPGTFYKPEELVAYEKRVEQMQDIILKNRYCTIPCIETGGIDPKNHVRIVRNQGVKINFDTMHFMLDLQHLMPDKDYASQLEADRARDQFALQWYNDNKDIIANFHFTQTTKGNDLHKGIFENGFSQLNELILQRLYNELRTGERKELFAITESRFDVRNFVYLDSLLRGDLTLSVASDNKYATLFTGLPATGCSESLKACSELWSTVFSQSDMSYAFDSDKVKRDYINNPHGSSISLKDNEVFPLDFRRYMYEKVYYSMLAGRLSKGRGFAFAACFNLKDIRDSYYQMFEQQGAKDVYIIYHTAEDSDIKARLGARAVAKNCNGTDPTFVLSDFEAYAKMKQEGPEFVPAEVSGRQNYHVIVYDTSNQQMTLHNKDDRLEQIAYVLRRNAEQKFGAKAVVR